MADPTIRARLTLDTSGYQKGVQTAQKSTGTFAQVRNTMAGVFGGNLISAGAAQVKDFFTGAIQGAVSAEQANTRFSTTLGNLGFAKQVGPANKFLGSLSKQAAVSKGELRPVFEQMLRSTHDFGKAQQATALAVDVAAGSGRDLSSVSLAMGRAFQGNTGALGRLGIKVKGIVPDFAAVGRAQDAAYKAQVAYTAAVKKHGPNSDQAKAAANKLADAQDALTQAQKKTKSQALPLNAVMQSLSQTFGGQAAKQADTAAGRMKNAQIQFKQFQVTVGQALLPVLVQLLGVFMQFLPILQSVSSWVKQNSGLFKALGLAIVVVVVAMKAWQLATAAWAAVQGIATGAMALFNAVVAANPIVLIIGALVLLGAALFVAYQKVGWFRAAVDATWQAIQVAFHAIVAAGEWLIGFFVGHWQILLAVIGGPIGLAVVLIIRYWNQVVAAARVVVAAVRVIWQAFVIAFQLVAAYIRLYVSTILIAWNVLLATGRVIVAAIRLAWNGLSIAFNAVAGAVRAAIGGISAALRGPLAVAQAVVSGIKSAFNSLAGFIRGIVGGVSSAAQSVANAVKGPVNAVIRAMGS